jgi:NADH-quinone oxidoreductase subunit H
MLAGSLSFVDIINRQLDGLWYILFLPVPALFFLIAGIAETARSPFDLLEAESEIVAGFHVEYSGMKFALFFLGEYVSALAIAFIFAALFLGGYAGPIAPGMLWLLLKAAVVFTILMWLRGTLPRIRVDQMHDMNWKFFVPLSIVNLITLMLLGKIFGTPGQNAVMIVPPLAQAVIFSVATLTPFIAALMWAARRTQRQRETVERIAEQRRAENKATVAAVTAAGGAH